jgi:hypothetical protein
MVGLDGPTSMVRLLKIQFTKPFNPSLGVNRMWANTNDHAAKMCVFFYMCPKMTDLKKNQV